MKMRQYLVGAIVHGRNVYFYRHLDVFPRGANVTIEVLHRLFEDTYERYGGLPKRLYLQMDNCWRENKNRFVMAYLSDLVYKVFVCVCSCTMHLIIKMCRVCLWTFMCRF